MGWSLSHTATLVEVSGYSAQPHILIDCLHQHLRCWVDNATLPTAGIQSEDELSATLLEPLRRQHACHAPQPPALLLRQLRDLLLEEFLGLRPHRRCFRIIPFIKQQQTWQQRLGERICSRQPSSSPKNHPCLDLPDASLGNRLGRWSFILQSAPSTLYQHEGTTLTNSDHTQHRLPLDLHRQRWLPKRRPIIVNRYRVMRIIRIAAHIAHNTQPSPWIRQRFLRHKRRYRLCQIDAVDEDIRLDDFFERPTTFRLFHIPSQDRQSRDPCSFTKIHGTATTAAKGANNQHSWMLPSILLRSALDGFFHELDEAGLVWEIRDGP